MNVFDAYMEAGRATIQKCIEVRRGVSIVTAAMFESELNKRLPKGMYATVTAANPEEFDEDKQIVLWDGLLTVKLHGKVGEQRA